MYKFEGCIVHAYIYHVLFIKKKQQQKQQKQQQQYNYCEMHCMRKRVHLFYIEVNMSYHVPLQWNALRFEKMQGVKGTIISKRCITPFKGII